METIYREMANGRFEFWTYVEGRRIYLNATTAANWMKRGTARMITVE